MCLSHILNTVFVNLNEKETGKITENDILNVTILRQCTIALHEELVSLYRIVYNEKQFIYNMIVGFV